jgi:hypothetical protein
MTGSTLLPKDFLLALRPSEITRYLTSVAGRTNRAVTPDRVASFVTRRCPVLTCSCQ